MILKPLFEMKGKGVLPPRCPYTPVASNPGTMFIVLGWEEMAVCEWEETGKRRRRSSREVRLRGRVVREAEGRRPSVGKSFLRRKRNEIAVFFSRSCCFLCVKSGPTDADVVREALDLTLVGCNS